MKKVLILALSVLLVFGLATISLAAVAISGEVEAQAGLQGWQKTYDVVDYVNDASANYNPASMGEPRSHASAYLSGKLTLNGKFTDALSATVILKSSDKNRDNDTYWSNPLTEVSSLTIDEAAGTYTGDWGSVKFGYFGWNNNLTDILNVWTPDIKNYDTVALSHNLSDNFNFSLAFAFTGDQGGVMHVPWINDYPGGNINGPFLESALNAREAYKNPFGGDLGFISTEGTYGGDLLFFHYNDQSSAWGINAYLKLGDFKPFVEYRNFNPYSVVNCIVGLTYESADSPLYGRAELEFSNKGVFAYQENVAGITYIAIVQPNYQYIGQPWGFRIGYKLPFDSRIEAQYCHTGYDLGPIYNAPQPGPVAVPSSKYYLKWICPLKF